MADEKIVTVALSKLAAELAEKHEMSKKATTELLNAFVDLTVKNLKKGHKVRITGLGIFQVRKRPARMGRNPATGEQIKIKASKKLAFRAAKAAGLAYAYLPVDPSVQTPQEIARFAQLLKAMPKPVLAFCRSGNRSTRLYKATL